VVDQRALAGAARDAVEVVPTYVISDWRGWHGWTGAGRQAFLCGCLASLAENLGALGGRLVLRRGDVVEELGRLLAETGADALYLSADPDPAGRKLEARAVELARSMGVAVEIRQDTAVHVGEEVLNGEGKPYRVFTPYFKRWQALAKPRLEARPRSLATPADVGSLELPTVASWGYGEVGVALLEAGERAARERMKKFFGSGLLWAYGERRNIPAGQTTSRLSQDLRFGLISVRELHARCVELLGDAAGEVAKRGVQTYISELAWREFYLQLLWHFPEVLEHEFQLDYRGMQWEDDEGVFGRWAAGQTGFPIVDAGMRQLLATGFMHNRLRMIVAMFLTKDLHLDWRMGEAYFMRQLLDGEIASNNGGWQWSAGTGADAAPYFRIQNPWTQSKRFDPGGEYIREWLPELRDVPVRRLHEPPADGRALARGYVMPMVDHAEERVETLARFGVQRAGGRIMDNE
jgi:deoxyribodipyrimidine photo-lyase